MNRLFRNLTLAVLVMTGGLTATSARADTTGVLRVDDSAGLFSPDAVSKAKDTFNGTTFRSPTHLFVYSTDSIPESKKTEFDTAKKEADSRGRFFKSWSKELAKSKDRKGDVFVLLYRTEKNYFAGVVSDEESDVYRHFNDKKAKDVSDLFNRAMKSVLDQKLGGEAAKKEMDAALVSATELVISDLKDTAAPESGRKVSSSNRVSQDRKGSNVAGYICMFLCIGLGIWLVIGLIRAFTGGGGGGGGGGYGGGGGGGGGFMTSLMGGMFGAMAGMWMYNNLMGGHSFGNDAMAGDSYGNDGGTGDTGDGNYDGGAEASDGGGDWGDGDAGGGDFGGGGDAGGDWGGGGGDFGGGGGDFGGGGDW